MATLKQIEGRIAKLQGQAAELRRKKATSVIANIRKMMADHGLTVSDIADGAGSASGRKRGRPAGSRNKESVTPTKGKLPPKYRHPETGATWSGHARPPAWIKDVVDRSIFLIGGNGASVKPTKNSGAAAPTTKAASVKRASAKKVVAKKGFGKKAPARKRVAKTASAAAPTN